MKGNTAQPVKKNHFLSYLAYIEIIFSDAVRTFINTFISSQAHTTCEVAIEC